MPHTAKDKSRALSAYLTRRTGRLVTTSDADTLRRAEMTLRRWAEQECNGDVQRDEETGRPCRVSRFDGATRWPVADREKGALARVAALCDQLRFAYYHQTDPRGCALYVAPTRDGMTDSNYSSIGAACCEVGS